ncbi:hypothetical protein [Pedobacter sp.]|uniref:hypothetical protein n=1 Tax=Pedobacter sp. TaxID=1411316 RepID=UPI003D7FE0E0
MEASDNFLTLDYVKRHEYSKITLILTAMEPFEITVDDVVLTIEPQKDHSYKVFEAGIPIGCVTPDLNAGAWKPVELLTDERAQRIGQAIDRH